MIFKYVITDPSHTELDSLPRIPLTLSANGQRIDVIGLVDSGATVNVLPYQVGLHLGGVWDDDEAEIQLAGNLGEYRAMPYLVMAEVADASPVELAFAWVPINNVPLILGQMNFFMEFEVCFRRFNLEFEVKRKPQRPGDDHAHH